jgi:hypothetical protein
MVPSDDWDHICPPSHLDCRLLALRVDYVCGIGTPAGRRHWGSSVREVAQSIPAGLSHVDLNQ